MELAQPPGQRHRHPPQASQRLRQRQVTSTRSLSLGCHACERRPSPVKSSREWQKECHLRPRTDNRTTLSSRYPRWADSSWRSAPRAGEEPRQGAPQLRQSAPGRPQGAHPRRVWRRGQPQDAREGRGGARLREAHRSTAALHASARSRGEAAFAPEAEVHGRQGSRRMTSKARRLPA